jgi:hypothetical protein
MQAHHKKKLTSLFSHRKEDVPAVLKALLVAILDEKVNPDLIFTTSGASEFIIENLDDSTLIDIAACITSTITLRLEEFVALPKVFYDETIINKVVKSLNQDVQKTLVQKVVDLAVKGINHPTELFFKYYIDANNINMVRQVYGNKVIVKSLLRRVHYLNVWNVSEVLLLLHRKGLLIDEDRVLETAIESFRMGIVRDVHIQKYKTNQQRKRHVSARKKAARNDFLKTLTCLCPLLDAFRFDDENQLWPVLELFARELDVVLTTRDNYETGEMGVKFDDHYDIERDRAAITLAGSALEALAKYETTRRILVNYAEIDRVLKNEANMCSDAVLVARKARRCIHRTDCLPEKVKFPGDVIFRLHSNV